jgi:RNA polymerase sigma-70 factor (ECF subfamily)
VLTTTKQRPDAAAATETREFDDVYDQYFPFVWRCLRGFGVPRDALDDAAQDVFLVVHRQLSTFRGESTLRTWLFGIARHIAFNQQRGAQRKQAPLEPLLDEPAHSDPGPLEHAQDAEAAVFLETFLASLDDKNRDLFMLAVIEEMAMPEVASALGIPVNTAYTRLRRTRATFQQALARKGESP